MNPAVMPLAVPMPPQQAGNIVDDSAVHQKGRPHEENHEKKLHHQPRPLLKQGEGHEKHHKYPDEESFFQLFLVSDFHQGLPG